MNSNYFSSQVQSVISQMLLKLLDRLEAPGEAPKPTWVHPGPEAPAAAAGSNNLAGGEKAGKPSSFESIIQAAADKFEVDPQLIRSVIKTESNFNPRAVSQAGAQGLMQLMPGTAKGLGVKDAFDPVENITAGTRLLHRLLNRYDGDVSLALAAYNAGMGAVDRFGGIPPYRETQTYVNRVLKYYQSGKQWSA